MITAKWVTLPNGEWITLKGYGFSGITLVGIYIIWCNGKPAQVVRLGQGIIGARITAHKADPMITRHSDKGALLVTWADVPAHALDGVEAYLADHYRPLEGDRFPDVDLLQVNLPGA